MHLGQENPAETKEPRHKNKLIGSPPFTFLKGRVVVVRARCKGDDRVEADAVRRWCRAALTFATMRASGALKAAVLWHRTSYAGVVGGGGVVGLASPRGMPHKLGKGGVGCNLPRACGVRGVATTATAAWSLYTAQLNARESKGYLSNPRRDVPRANALARARR